MVYIITGVVLYLWLSLFTGWYINRIGISRRWTNTNRENLMVFGGMLWPLSWLWMSAWFVANLGNWSR
jgi:hypothetical protein